MKPKFYSSEKLLRRLNLFEQHKSVKRNNERILEEEGLEFKYRCVCTYYDGITKEPELTDARFFKIEKNKPLVIFSNRLLELVYLLYPISDFFVIWDEDTQQKIICEDEVEGDLYQQIGLVLHDGDEETILKLEQLFVKRFDLVVQIFKGYSEQHLKQM